MTTPPRRLAGRAIRKARRIRRAAVVELARDIGPDTPPDRIVRTR